MRGVDTGTNTTSGPLGENNGAIGGIGGFGLNNLLGGNMTILALTHIGPETVDAAAVACSRAINANGQWRSFNDIVITWKVSDSLTFDDRAQLGA